MVSLEPTRHSDFPDLVVIPVFMVQRGHETKICFGDFAEENVGRDVEPVDDIRRDAEDKKDPESTRNSIDIIHMAKSRYSNALSTDELTPRHQIDNEAFQLQ